MSAEAPQLFSDLARESRKVLRKAEEDRIRLAKSMKEISTDDRELIRENIEWMANYISQKYNVSPKQVRRILKEMLTVTV